jgi:hypothetical protein
VTDWDAWEVGRVVLATTALLYGGIWVQLSLFHWGAAFASKAMWVPVILTPVIVLAIGIGVLERTDPWGWIAAGALVLGVIDGLVGLYFHVRGTVAQVGGLTVRNLIAGPPPVLPLAYSLVGVVGLIALLWHA